MACSVEGCRAYGVKVSAVRLSEVYRVFLIVVGCKT